MDRRQQCVVDHDHRGGRRNGYWVGAALSLRRIPLLQRTGTMTIAGQTFTVTQAAPPPPPPPSCTYTIAPMSESMAAAGGAGTITVTAGGTCAWTAVSNASWITITPGATGPGPGSVNFIVAANTGAARTGTMTIAGHTFTVTQAGRATTTTELHLHDRADERVNRRCRRGRDSDRGHDGWHVRVDRRQQCLVDHDHPRGDRTGSWVGELCRCGESRGCANRAR